MRVPLDARNLSTLEEEPPINFYLDFYDKEILYILQDIISTHMVMSRFRLTILLYFHKRLLKILCI